MRAANLGSTVLVIGVDNGSVKTQITIAVEFGTNRENSNPTNMNKPEQATPHEEATESTDNQLEAFWESVSNAPPVTFFTGSPRDTMTYEEYRARRIQHIVASSSSAR